MNSLFLQNWWHIAVMGNHCVYKRAHNRISCTAWQLQCVSFLMNKEKNVLRHVTLFQAVWYNYWSAIKRSLDKLWRNLPMTYDTKLLYRIEFPNNRINQQTCDKIGLLFSCSCVYFFYIYLRFMGWVRNSERSKPATAEMHGLF